MSLFQKKKDPFSDELKKLEKESRRVEEESSRIEEKMRLLGEPLPESYIKKKDPDHFKGAMFTDGGQPDRGLPARRSALKIQKRKIRNQVIILVGVLGLLLLLLYRILA